ncbi:MAG: hypothetical protein ACOYLP_08800, partial [Flavobacterium sp.]|uniref:hypothetical protein n=1 Tax=Flavobacterium sp. TaxID=239 RepID=UPI003BB9F8D6
MEPNKLEKQLREKLSSREIQPSAQAWNRLDAMLSEAEEKKIKRPLGFLFIAASITVLLTVGIFFFIKNGPEIQPKNDVVTSETKDTIQKKVNEISTPRVENNQEVVSNQPTTDNRQPTTNNQRVSVSNQKSANANQQSSNQNPLINRDKPIQYLINSSDVALKDLPKIRSGSQVISGGNKEVISDEALLAGLDNLAKQSTNKKSNVKVDAKNLLSQIDGELE